MLWLLTSLAHAETIAGALPTADTVMDVLLENDGEKICFVGNGTLSVSLGGKVEGELTDGMCLEFPIGSYALELSEDLTRNNWSIYVESGWGQEISGRISSTNWVLSPVGYAITTSFYSQIPLNETTKDSVSMKFSVEGMEIPTGETAQVFVSQMGDGTYPFQSLSTAEGVSPTPLYSVYLNASEETAAEIAPVALSILATTVSAGLCPNTILPGVTSIAVRYDTPRANLSLLVCDTNGSGDVDLSGAGDVLIAQNSPEGENTISWDGLSMDREAIAAGSYACRVGVLQGSASFVLNNVQTADPGVRIFAYDSDNGIFDGVDQHWNDTRPIEALSGSEPTLSNGDAPLVYTEGPEGVYSGDTSTASEPGSNSHAWGNYTDESRGNDAWIVTAASADTVLSDPFTLQVEDLSIDSDGDNLKDAIELCLLSTEGDNADTDGDSLPDGTEVDDPLSPRDLDGDGLIDPLDNDDDDDTIATRTEAEDGAKYGTDVDADGFDNWYDNDSDGDGIPDEDEPSDANSNGVPDYLEPTVADTGATVDTGTPDEIGDSGAPMTTPGLLTGGGCANEMVGLFGLGWLLMRRGHRRRRRGVPR